MSCIFRSTKSCIRERFLIPGRVVYFSKWFQTVPLLSLWNQVVTGIACWSRECVLKILSVCKKDSAWVFEWCHEVFWWQDKGFFLSSSLSEATFGGPFQPNSFHESISTLLWRTTNTINLYKHKWINFIRNVMQPKSIVKFLLPSKETKHCTEYIIKWTGKHCHTAVTIVCHNSTLTRTDRYKHALTYRSANSCSGSAPGQIEAKESYYGCLYLLCYQFESVYKARPDVRLAARSWISYARVCLVYCMAESCQVSGHNPVSEQCVLKSSANLL